MQKREICRNAFPCVIGRQCERRALVEPKPGPRKEKIEGDGQVIKRCDAEEAACHEGQVFCAVEDCHLFQGMTEGEGGHDEKELNAVLAVGGEGFPAQHQGDTQSGMDHDHEQDGDGPERVNVFVFFHEPFPRSHPAVCCSA